MLTYKEYLSESVYKLTRVETGVFSVRDAKLQETGIVLDQNYAYGKNWDIMVEGISKGTFKTKHQATLFIEQFPNKLIENYSVLTLVDEAKNSYLDKLVDLIHQKTGDVMDNLLDYPMWKLVEVDSKLISAELYSDRSYRKLVISI